MNTVAAVVIASLGSSGLFALIQFLIQRKDKKKDDIGQIKRKLDKLERDSCRTQMLVLMSDYKEEKQELMKLAYHYFVDLDGDWYFTDVFAKWLVANGIEKPSWFRKDHSNE